MKTFTGEKFNLLRKISNPCGKLSEVKTNNIGVREIVDRDYQINTLQQIFINSKIHGETTNLTLIAGPSGTGKSTLALSLKKHVIEAGGFFISGKFDQSQTMKLPYDAFSQAFNEFVRQVMERDSDAIESLKNHLHETIQDESFVLVKLIPEMKRLIKVVDRSANIYGLELQYRLHQVIRKFVKIISSPITPVVIMLDDLQWSDTASLGLLAELIEETKNEGFMIIVTCRSNEVAYSHPFSQTLRDLEAKNVTINEIQVSNWDSFAVKNYISRVLELPDFECDEFSEWLFEKTNGNILFLIEHELSVAENDIKLEDSALASLPNCNDVVDLISHIIKRQDWKIQHILAVASCLGSEFDQILLMNAVVETVRFEELLKSTADSMLLVFDQNSHLVRFTHDKIQQASYFIIPDNERVRFHLELGKRLLQNLSHADIDKYIFVIVNQLSLGEALVTEPNERTELTSLCLRAGERATSLSAFQAASDYFQRGISFLDFRHWRDEYEISLALFNAQAEVEYVIGNFDKANEAARVIIENARSFEDSLRAFAVKVYVSGALNNASEAISIGFDVLQRLGEAFPQKPRVFHILKDLIRTKLLLRRFDIDSICNLSIMTNPFNLASMRMLAILFPYTYSFNPDLLPLITFRMIQITLKSGICAISSTAFAGYGMLLCCSFRRIDEGYEYGKLALAIADKFQTTKWYARCFSGVFGMINTWKDSYEHSLEPLRRAHRLGMSTGDVEFGMQAANIFYVISIFSGKRSLADLSEEMEIVMQTMIDSKQDLILNNFLPNLQLVLNLQGLASDPIILSGKVMNQNELLKDASAKRNDILISAIHQYRTLLAFYIGDLKAALRASKDRAAVRKLAVTPFGEGEQYFVECLIALSLSQTEKSRHHHMRLARKKFKEFEKVARYGRPALINRLTLLRGEFAALKGHLLEASTNFMLAAEHAEKEGNLSDQALAYAQAGLAFKRFRVLDQAKICVEKSITLYKSWGAVICVQSMEALLGSLKNPNDDIHAEKLLKILLRTRMIPWL
jgi:histidine kinase